MNIPDMVMSLLVGIMLYWSTYLGCKDRPSFLFLRVPQQLCPVLLQSDLSIEITLSRYILSTKDIVCFCKLILIYLLTSSRYIRLLYDNFAFLKK